jgi:UDP-N-acetyl-D-mannosaminuronate dehydrogenase
VYRFRKNIRIEIQLGLLQAIHLKELIRDKEHTVEKILKVTSGSTQKLDKSKRIYKSVITAGTHLAPSIKVARSLK